MSDGGKEGGDGASWERRSYQQCSLISMKGGGRQGRERELKERMKEAEVNS